MIAEMTIGQSPNPHWAQLPLFDRSKWETVRFGDVVELVSETSRNPEAEGITRYIGLEHLEPGSLHIKTWGELVDGVTFTKRCRKGQVLFGKRRAYQRKVAVAEFDALVSGDIYVFQAKEELLDPKLLPFLCMSERFFQFAVETSAGSLSPRTNWSHLAEFEFALPPLDQQRRIAELLWAMDDSIRLTKNTAESLFEAVDILRDEIIYGNGQSPDWPYRRIEDITLLVTKGESPTWQGFKYEESGVRYITSENVLRDQLNLEPVKFISPEFHKKLKRSAVEANDILVTLVGGSLGRACIAPDGLGQANVNQAVAVVKPDYSQALPGYVLSGLQSPTGFKRLLAARVETFKANISLGTIRSFVIPVPPLSYQSEFCERVLSLQRAALEANVTLEAITDVRSELLKQLFKQVNELQ